MIRLLSIAALAASTLAIGGGAHAQAPAGYYVAVPATAPTKTALMTRATPWTLRDGVYVAAKAPEREMVLCQLVAKDAGTLSSFSAGGKAFAADELAKCNARARTITTQTAAR